MTDFQVRENDIEVHIGKRIRQRRRMVGLTQAQLGKKCDVGFQQIQKYECGANRIHAARLWQIAQALEVDTNFFYIGLPPSEEVAQAHTSSVQSERGCSKSGRRSGTVATASLRDA